MTRLKTEWIEETGLKASAWDMSLNDMLGAGYDEILEAVGGKTCEEIAHAKRTLKVAAVPVTQGEGIIGNFAESVAGIVKAAGFSSFVTLNTDVNGLYEAKCKGADIVFLADDDRYIALNLNNGRIGDNNIATADAYAKILCRMSWGLEGKDCLVLGFGIIGQLMAETIRNKGGNVYVFEKNPEKKKAVLEAGYFWISNQDEIKRFKYIADGTNVGDWLKTDMLNSEALISAPGIPLSLDIDAREQFRGRYIHDLLEIGTIGMLGLAI